MTLSFLGLARPKATLAPRNEIISDIQTIARTHRRTIEVNGIRWVPDSEDEAGPTADSMYDARR